MTESGFGMEDGSNSQPEPPTLKNGEKPPVMANFPDVEVGDVDQTESTLKVNGDSKSERISVDDSNSSDCDVLIIDEKPQKSRKRKLLNLKPRTGGFRGFKKPKTDSRQFEPPTNPYFNESLFELSELHQKNHTVPSSDKSKDENKIKKLYSENWVENEGAVSSIPSAVVRVKNLTKNKKNSSPKREYAQYLGLQPTVQFKCSKCGVAGFESLGSLNEHHIQCSAEGPITPTLPENIYTAASTNFRVTRKVFLCSACGTYYENWNLFLHMREVHKRFICLYCLGMFSLPEKLSVHLLTKHNCVPNHFISLDEFFNIHSEPCYVMCCNCESVFSEHDNFFDHNCPDKTPTEPPKHKVNSGKNSVNKQTNSKNTKPGKNKNFVQHVTGDNPQNTTQPPTSAAEEPPMEEGIEKQVEERVNEIVTENLKENPSEDDLSAKSDQAIDALIETPPVSTETNDEVIDTKVKEEINCDNLEINTTEARAQTNSEDETQSDHDRSSDVSQPNEDETMGKDGETNHSEPEVKLEDVEPSPTHLMSEATETRRVPKVTLRLPKNMAAFIEPEDSDDSDKLTMEVDVVEDDSQKVQDENIKEEEEEHVLSEPTCQVAGVEIPIIALELEQPLDKFDIQLLLQKCLKETAPTCVYCNYARKISVNGKQLGLHTIAEHRFSAVVNSITAEELIPESFVAKIQENLTELQGMYFNIESTSSDEAVTFSHIFECFQCRYATSVHKELYLHNRKMHAKTILLCIMCKSNFYSYSELICHLCPGLYELDSDISFRCCMCVSDILPSAFRLMVHLRKRHHACDVCLEMCHNQSKLSNHVWKHKLHHLCYRCGIAYRNKPDITKHLFWKHGTESQLCKKCLQKKWPHVYHFCIPPSTFTCEECNLSFTRAVFLKVHKRLHCNEKPHTCTFENCTEQFISKKLLLKHEFKHREPPEEILEVDSEIKDAQSSETAQDISESHNKPPQDEPANNNEENGEEKSKPKPKVDVYDLPELNLSESDSSESEEETQKDNKVEAALTKDLVDSALAKSTEEPVNPPETNTTGPVLDNIWDDFKNYQASKEKVENDEELADALPSSSKEPVVEDSVLSIEIVLRDHDYCLVPAEEKPETKPEHLERTQSIDHDYCSPTGQTPQSLQKSEKPSSPSAKLLKKEGTSSSSDSDSSSCTCGSNCSCSSSSSTSSSSDSSGSDSSSSEGRRRQQARREKRKLRAKNKKESENSAIDVVATENVPSLQFEPPIQESDLDTTETETDEDFYDKQPQKIANKLLAEKRNQLLMLAGIGPLINGSMLESSRPSTPSLPETEEVKPRKKSKSKKRKKKSKRQTEENPARSSHIPSTSRQHYHPPLMLSLPRNSPLTVPVVTPPLSSTTMLPPIDENLDIFVGGNLDNDPNQRASKRRRVPNRFYGYSSEEEHEKHLPPVLKWRKADLPSPAKPLPVVPQVVPPITIKTVQPTPPTVDPISIRPSAPTGELHIQQPRILQQSAFLQRHRMLQEQEAATDSEESSTEDEQPSVPRQNQPPLYCYCRCPYDEVSEMIGCDADDCAIEWFHFECVGIMVPPKGQWFCPDCRRKRQQRRDVLQT